MSLKSALNDQENITMKKVAIQGINGSNHHRVVQENFLEDVEILECSTFDEMVYLILNNEATHGVMALENSIVGSILPNYALIDANNLTIVDENYLNISHNIMGLKGQTLDDITEVHSHYMALLQCKDFFKMRPHISLVEDTDTALTAKRISEENLKGIAALAPISAAEIYGLEVFEKDVHSIKNNATRFVTISKSNEIESYEKINKASLKFELSSKRGSLAAVLNVMSDCNLNLTKIQSLPIIETPWNYSFFVDVVFNTYTDFAKAKKIVSVMAENFKVFGEYENKNRQ